MIISWVNEDDLGNLSHVNLIYDIHMLHVLSNTYMEHISRASNSVADRLAKRGSAMDSDNIEWGDL